MFCVNVVIGMVLHRNSSYYGL